jgi:hypothetical protein
MLRWLKCRMGWCEFEYVGPQSEAVLPWYTRLWNHRCKHCGRETSSLIRSAEGTPAPYAYDKQPQQTTRGIERLRRAS